MGSPDILKHAIKSIKNASAFGAGPGRFHPERSHQAPPLLSISAGRGRLLQDTGSSGTPLEAVVTPDHPDALLWKENVDKEFEGVEPCPVCYSVLHVKSHKLPNLECKT